MTRTDLGAVLLVACTPTRHPGGGGAYECAIPGAATDAAAACQQFCDTVQRCAGGGDSYCPDACLQRWRLLETCVRCVDTHGCDAMETCKDACASCDTDADCAPGRSCSGYRCIPRECTVSSDCPCVGSCDGGLCDPPGCFSDAECPRADACVGHACVPAPCHADADCRSGACDPALSRCTGARCGDGSGCATGETCDAGLTNLCMTVGCADDRDCPTGTHCARSRSCVP